MSTSSPQNNAEARRPDESQAAAESTPTPDKETDDPRVLHTTAEAPILPPSEPPSRVVGEYEVFGSLGSGGMGEVYKARHRRLNKFVALKLLPAGSQSTCDLAARFQREMQAVGDLDHPNVVEAYDAGEQSGEIYLAMKLIDGIDLERLVKKRGPLPIAEACELVRQAALGLHYLHQRGLVHRDIKPSNLMQAPDGTVKILDLGLARWCVEAEQGHGLTGTGRAMGTPDFLAPEQVENAADADARADLYGLGGTLFYLLAGRPPFADRKSQFSKLEAHRSEPPPDLRKLRPDVSEELAALVHRLLAKKPEERYQTAAETAAMLKPFAENAPTQMALTTDWLAPPSQVSVDAETNRRGAASSSLAQRMERWSGSRKLSVGMAVVVLVGLPFWWWLDTRPHTTTHSSSVTAGKRPMVRAPEPIHVSTMHVILTRHPNNPKLSWGSIGESVFDPHLNDYVTVQAHLTRPAYAFLIAFQPDGRSDVCFPEEKNEVPERTDKPRYPSTSVGRFYQFDEGAGLHAFALVVSSQPLPSFQEWWPQHREGCPWQKENAPPGVVYRANGEDPVEVLTAGGARGKGAEAKGMTLVAKLAAWLHAIPQVETVQVLAFTVEPPEKR